MSNGWLRDLYGHQTWADAEHWPAFGAHQAARDDQATQCAMHSHYHRGQNATRLRELGGEPPTTDLIVWHWKGRPAPAW